LVDDMILITGGLGFIGAHTTRALLDLGESCVLVSRTTTDVPAAFADDHDRVVVERADITDRTAFLEIGGRHDITGIVHLAHAVGTHGPIDDARRQTGGLLTVLEAARDWQVPRVGTASTIGVYGDAAGGSPYREDVALPMTAGHAMPAFKKIGELLADHIARHRHRHAVRAGLRPGHRTAPTGGHPAPPHVQRLGGTRHDERRGRSRRPDRADRRP
jgi:UDP-glucose 4-epimerase